MESQKRASFSDFKVGDRVKHKTPGVGVGTVVEEADYFKFQVDVRWDNNNQVFGAFPENLILVVGPTPVEELDNDIPFEPAEPAVNASGEVRYVDPVTGGQKGKKLEEYGLIPPGALEQVARVYGMGAKKYDAHNWAKGYPWSLSYSALYRHIEKTRKGEWLDEESGLPHLAHAAFHLFTLLEFEEHGLGTDDRWIPGDKS